MDLNALRVATVVLARGSFASVARDLRVEPSSVSRMVAAVEAELGFRLFQRTTRRLAPTEAGAAYLAKASGLLLELEAAAEEASAATAGPSGVLRLTASVAFGTRRILPLLPEFRRMYPALGLDLVFSDDTLDLVRERVDLAVRLAPAVTGDLVCSRLMDTHYKVVATTDYWSRAGMPGSPGDIAGHRCLLFALPAFRSRWIFRDERGDDHEVPVAGDLVFTNALSLYLCVLMGLGPALLPDWLIETELANGSLVEALPSYRATATTFDTAAWIIYPSRAYLPGKVRVAIDFLRARLPVGAPARLLTPPEPSRSPPAHGPGPRARRRERR